MQNEENKKNGPIDYSKFFEQERENPETEEIISKKERKSFLSNLKFFWNESDEKIKIQIIFFLLAIFLTIIILSFYFLKSESKSFEEPIIPVPYGEEEMLGQ